MLPAHVRYQVKADNSTVAVSSQQSGEFPRQLSVSAPVSSSSSRSVPASWQPRAGTRVAGVALSHARLPRGSATCLRSADWTPAADLCSNTVLALPSPLHASCSVLSPPCPAALYRSRLPVSRSPAARTSPLRSWPEAPWSRPSRPEPTVVPRLRGRGGVQQERSHGSGDDRRPCSGRSRAAALVLILICHPCCHPALLPPLPRHPADNSKQVVRCC